MLEASTMKLNADFTQRVVVHAASLDWKASPMPGVERRMLDRIGDEVARHLDRPLRTREPFLAACAWRRGRISRARGRIPGRARRSGYYVRNPPQSHHTPGSMPGCTMFVKLGA